MPRNPEVQTELISPNQLAARWAMSRTGAIQICERAEIPSLFIGSTPRGSRRFRMSDIEAHERRCLAAER